MVFSGCGMATTRWLDGRSLDLAQVTATVSLRCLVAPSMYVGDYIAWQGSPDFEYWKKRRNGIQ